MEDKTLALDNLSRLIEDTEKLMEMLYFRNNYTLDTVTETVDDYFSKYEYKPNIIKGLISVISHREILERKRKSLKSCLGTLKKVSKKIEVDNVVITEENFVDFYVQKIINYRVEPLLNYVIEEIDLCLPNDSKNDIVLSDEEMDLSDSTTSDKIVMLYLLGVFDFLKEQEPFNVSTNALASVLSAVTGGKKTTIQSYINPIVNSDTFQKNNPLKEKQIQKNKSKLIDLGFNPSK